MIDKEDCSFFHVVELPGGELTPGQWDFRETEAAYHGHYPLKGKTVLEVGTATGSHAFWMEKQGAHVTPIDLSPAHSWDIMVTPTQNEADVRAQMQRTIRTISNGWTYCRDRLGSNLTLHHGSTYDIPPELGDFDVITYGSVLLHTRDPIGALQHGAARAKEAVMIMDRMPPNLDPERPLMEFMPKLGNEKTFGGWTWWWISPQTFINALTIMGFREFSIKVSPHLYTPTGRKLDLFTLIAMR